MNPGLATLPTWTAPHRPDWHARAACRDAELELFFEPARREPPCTTRKRHAAALAYCADCQVARECLETTVAAERGRRPYGIAGGTTAEQRRARRRERAASP